MNSNEEFEKWADGEGFDIRKSYPPLFYTHSNTRDALRGWNARQPEIDALIHDNDNMRKAIVEYDKENASLKAEVEKLNEAMTTRTITALCANAEKIEVVAVTSRDEKLREAAEEALDVLENYHASETDIADSIKKLRAALEEKK